jgi:hypothetical protein
MMTAVPRRAAEDEAKFQSKDLLEEAGIQLAQGEIVEASLLEKVIEQ